MTAYFIDRRSGNNPAPSRRRAGRLRRNPFGGARASSIRARDSPVPSGRIQWRGVVEGEPFLGGRTHVTMGFSNQRAVVYPISREAADRGRSRINWVTVLGQQSASGANAAPGTARCPRIASLTYFKDWNFAWIKFADLICRTEEIYEYPLRRIATPCRAGVLAA